jgi:predicted N-acyltransferase
MNMPAGQYVKGTVLMRTLPTILFENKFEDFESYMQALRHPYRRRLRIIMAKSQGVDYVVTKCNDFTDLHYKLYLEIMKRTKTRLETLSLDLFKNLPGNFTLGSEYHNGSLLAWHTLCYDGNVLYFFFGGMDYEQRDRFQSYYNNLLNILKTGLTNRSIRLDFGQTAEIAKMRLGGTAEERSMFVYHKNPMVLSLFKLAKPLIAYTRKSIEPKVFK